MTRTPSLADYRVAKPDEIHSSLANRGELFAYVLAADGLYVSARREGLRVCFRIAEAEVRGLLMVQEKVRLAYPKVPAEIVARIMNRSREACVEEGKPVEALFYLGFDRKAGEWQLVEPRQRATGGSVRPEDEFDESYQDSLIELHSHHQMEAFWSGTDDADEQGFKLYAVVGQIFTKPTLRVRVGCFGYFHEVPAEEIFELPGDVRGGGN